MNKFKIIGVFFMVMSPIVFWAGNYYFQDSLFIVGPMFITLFVNPASVILFVIGLSFIFSGNFTAIIKPSNDGVKFFKNRLSFLLFLLVSLILLVAIYYWL